jgi:alpha-1,6-mannosyltransferase
VTTRIAVALGAATAIATALAVVASRHASPADVSPVTPRGSWDTAWIAGVVVALACYAVGALAAARARLPLRVALAFALVIQVLPLASPLLLSADTYLYWAEGRVITAHHANPYVTTPSAYPSDPAAQFASPEWRTQSAPYGPVWETIGTAPAAAAGTSRDDAQLGYRVLALLGVLACIGLVAWGTRNAAAVAFLGWSPVLALHYAGGGHSDAWMIALLLLALVARGRASGGAAWPLAAGFKAIPVLFLPLELARTRLRQPRSFWLGLGVSATVILAASLAVFGIGWIKGSSVAAHANSPLGGVHWLTEAGLRHRYAVAVGALAFAVVYAALLVHAWRRGRARMSLAASALVLCVSLVRPWYALWPTALAAAEVDAAGAVAALALGAYLLLGDAVRF